MDFWQMASFLNTLMVLMNYAGGQQVDGRHFLTVPDQFTAKVELVLLNQNLVEEFHIMYDRDLNLVKYEYTLDNKVPPYHTSNPIRTIWDFNTGTIYDIDTTTNLCSISYADPNGTATDISTHSLVRMLSPEQLFSTNAMLTFSKKDLTRGMQSDVWSADMSDFYLAGYGYRKTHHTLRTLAGTVRKYYKGTDRQGVLLQRAIYLQDNESDPVMTINYFDFDAPTSPKLYDFSVLSCLNNVKTEPTEEIMVRFPGWRTNVGMSLLAMDQDPAVLKVRRQMWKEMTKAMGISPLRSIGNFWSWDDWNSYFTTVILPRPNPTNFYDKMIGTAPVRFQGVGVQESTGGRAFELGFQMLIQTCAERCMSDKKCKQFAWCPGNTSWKMYTCVLQPDTNVDGAGEQNVLHNCEFYRGKYADKDAQPDVTEALDTLGQLVIQRRFSLKAGGDKSLIADQIRRNVSLMSTTKGEKQAETFSLYRPYSVLRTARVTFNKLTNKQCMEKCLQEDRFVCQSISICGFGDCSLTEYHGDEIVLKGDNLIANHSHCAIWSRVWTNEYIKVSPAFFRSLPPVTSSTDLAFVEREETCAKRCTFSTEADGCESFVYCAKGQTATTQKSTCMLYSQHVFDQPEENPAEEVTNVTCSYYTQNYLTSFKSLRGLSLTKREDHEIAEIEVPARLGEWRCAKACIDILGDSGCLSMEICLNNPGNAARSPDSTNRCRFSSVFVSTNRKKPSNITYSNDACTVYSRSKYLDGSPVTERTSASSKVTKLDKRSDIITQVCVAGGHGYSATDMTVLALSMLIAGCGLVGGCIFHLQAFPSR
ncbi:uncharacterized protein LOC129594135 [Paramacrobiotus metropolitanus]|uniref:uncharacterized protein LOC129594135 n=1 Tax=Paramacrobiotus metropolitanus TaxID=2943436 RepID=UPI002445EE53|nr:uncharacterized protein LOC129594135 [Paramacrobiotus metropolitanus]